MNGDVYGYQDGVGYFHSDGCGDVIIYHMIVSAVRNALAGIYAWEDMARAGYRARARARFN